ncbi:GFA family protein [Endozoicomonas numazuensis]|uniref:CENP-V/GFA domain-containing protein n=1 Tax=Endozoicomonas numazuensis TaxID=1137799 RepID=A0A081NGF9_9GAMM|nr:hypothetical protein [Endozoicomonas numazuensis]KEQ17532.1 hypothetical protein GZ78_17435 [Endozoicomonas numazuensis]
MFKASCHCGGIVLNADEAPETITSCNCSICHRIGALWGYYLDEQVETQQTVAIQDYRWGDKTITFHTCSGCGCTTHYTAVREDGKTKIGLNTRMVSREDTKDIRVRYFDGADTWGFLKEES